jgi:hypothetical protein
MASAYFASLVALPTIIDQPGEYLTRAGEVVRIGDVSAAHDFGCIGTYHCGPEDHWHRSGRLYASSLSRNDIVSKRSL